MQGQLQGVISKPCICPVVGFGSRFSSRIHARLNSLSTLTCPIKTTIPRIKIKSHPLRVSAFSTSVAINFHKHDFLQNLQPPPNNRGPYHPKASKGGLFDFKPYPRMTEKPKWWWRTLACVPYLMTFYQRQYWTYAHPANNPPPFLENFNSWVFPLVLAIFTLPKLFNSCYAFFSWLFIVRQKCWPHFFRLHVITAILVGSLVEAIGLASGWFPSWFFPPHFWSAATFVFLVTVSQCIIYALGGRYPDVPFVKDAAHLHADI